jgi:plasmid stability protein
MEAPMAQLVVRNLEDDVKAKLQKRARQNGHSTEEEVRDILRNAVKSEKETHLGLGTRIAKRFAKVGLRKGEDIHEQRGYPSQPAEFDP